MIPAMPAVVLILAAALTAELVLVRLRAMERRDDEEASRRRIRAELAARERRQAAARHRRRGSR